jgi:sugar lactone lactonase YvrE
LLPGQLGDVIDYYPPHFLFSIYGVEQPVAVAGSPNGDQIYVAESGGERTIKIFDRDGELLDDFDPPMTTPGERAPVGIAVDSEGRVFVSDRKQRAIFVFDREGNYLDTLLGPDLSLSEYIAKHIGGLPDGSTFYYNGFYSYTEVHYQLPGREEDTLPRPDRAVWSPAGLRFDGDGNLWITDFSGDDHYVRMISADIIAAPNWREFDPEEFVFGFGGGEEDLLFPNSVAVDSQGRTFVSDSNNYRVSTWESKEFLFSFSGQSDNRFSLPRGIWIDGDDRLHVVDAVGHNIKVIDVSGDEPVYLETLGELGTEDGLFHFPNDIFIDETGRLYIADRENNRVQVWSY